MNKQTHSKKTKKRIQISLSEKSYKDINNRAEKIGVPLQEYIRHKLLYNTEDFTEELVEDNAKQYGEAIQELKSNKKVRDMGIDELIRDLKN